uniref:Ribosomal RNA methyltransferase FtsJ domain-containing protein n=1 Tax=viral metagenome TaxID=1070528 RepID=A0A6C0H7E5_9ZZZZ
MDNLLSMFNGFKLIKIDIKGKYISSKLTNNLIENQPINNLYEEILLSKIFFLLNNNDISKYTNYYIYLKQKFIYSIKPFNINLYALFSSYLFYKIGQTIKTILCYSDTYQIIEILNYYYKDILITHLNNGNIEQNKIKQIYKFDDFNITKYNITIKYDLIIILFLSFNIDILNNINKNGYLIIYLSDLYNNLLLLQNIGQCFENMYIIYNIYSLNNINEHCIIFEKFKKNVYSNNNMFYSKYIKTIKAYYKILNKDIHRINLQLNYIRENINNQDFINSLIKQNYIYSYNLAKLFKFQIYESEDINTITSKLFIVDKGLYLIMRSHIIPIIKIQCTNNNILPQEFNYLIKLINCSTNQIDFRDIDTYNKIKKLIRFYENTLNHELYKLDIKIKKNRPVSRAWIKMYEILYNTRIFDTLKDINIFYMCEAPGSFIMSIDYYINKWNSNAKYTWEATTLHTDNGGYDDIYDIIKKNKNKWSYGSDGTGNITSEDNIKYYKNICKNKNWLISDCGLEYSEDNTLCILLYYSQMLFILYNLSKHGNCIIKQLFTNLHYKILIDMIYIFYLSFEKIEIYKPTQNEHSPEFYMICFNYNNKHDSLSDEDFIILFNILKLQTTIKNISIINKYHKDFIFQYYNILEKIINQFNMAIDRQLFYTDYLNIIKDTETNDSINHSEYIKLKNKDWIIQYIYRK